MTAAKMSYLEKVDHYLDSLKTGKSAIVDSWFMMSSPMPIVSVVVAYFLVIRIGPRLMQNRSPMRLHKTLSYYNAFQVLLAAMICVKVFKLNMFRDGIIYAGCRYPSHTQNPMLLDVGWWYFFAKLTELLDTVFFVLRKKDKQITFLHVYHHVVMALYSWSYLKFAAGGEGAVLALLNSMVHVVMYTYYLLAGLGPRFQKYLWWKKYVTKMQLMQFLLMLSYCAWTYFSPRCQYAVGFTYFISVNVTIFLILFLNFYSKSYKKQREAEKNIQKELKNASNGVLKNGVHKVNGIKEDISMREMSGGDILRCGQDASSLDDDDVPCEVNKGCGDFTKNSKVFLTRRTVKQAYGAEYDFDSIIKK